MVWQVFPRGQLVINLARGCNANSLKKNWLQVHAYIVDNVCIPLHDGLKNLSDSSSKETVVYCVISNSDVAALTVILCLFCGNSLIIKD